MLLKLDKFMWFVDILGEIYNAQDNIPVQVKLAYFSKFLDNFTKLFHIGVSVLFVNEGLA